MKIYLKMQPHDILIAADTDAEEYLQKIAVGDVIQATVSKPRNYKYHKKFFALLDIAYDAFDPVMVNNKYGTPQKNKDQFREDITILAGYYDQYYRLDGSIRTVAKSISFASMSEDDFGKLYNSVINVILERVLTNYTKSDLDNQVARVMEFT